MGCRLPGTASVTETNLAERASDPSPRWRVFGAACKLGRAGAVGVRRAQHRRFLTDYFGHNRALILRIAAQGENVVAMPGTRHEERASLKHCGPTAITML